MRIATSQYQAMMNQSLLKNQTRITELTEQMANGNRIQVPSDDPVDSVRMSRLRREEAAIGQYRANITAVQQRMSKNEGYLTNIVNDMNAGRDLLVWASDGSNTPADLKSMVTSLSALVDSLKYTANTKDQEGRYIFSGTATDKEPIAENASSPRFSYGGNEDPQMVVVGNGMTQIANQNVKDLETLLNQLDKTITALKTNAPDLHTTLQENLDGFDTAMDTFSKKIAILGGQQNILTTMDANHANVSLSNQMAITQIGQLDVGAASIELNGYSTALQASYKAYSKIGSLSLFAAL